VRRFVAGAIAAVAIASTAVACTQPTAPPSRPLPPTGRQLRTMLPPVSSFPAGTRADGEFDSSKTPITGHGLAQPNLLEDQVAERPCTALGSDNFGQIAYVVEEMINPAAKDLFYQQINQFRTPIAATRYFSRYYSDLASCAPRYGSGGNSGQSILIVQQLTVDGYHAFSLTYYVVSGGQAPIADSALLVVDDRPAVLLEAWEGGGTSDPATAIAALEPRIIALIARVAKGPR
jgi:hypothetical protein